MNHDNDIVTQPIGMLEEAQSPTNWVTLTRFEVYVKGKSKITAPVYANGLQAVPVEIVVEARDADNVVVQLTQLQLNNIKLIDYVTGNQISEYWNEYDDRFIYHWDLIRGDDADSGSGGDLPGDAPEVTAQPMMKYVIRTRISSQKIAAEITSPSGGVFRTNTANPPAGKFDSWVIVDAREAPVYSHRDLTMEKVNEVTNSTWDVDLYYIRFNEGAFKIVASTHLDAEENTPHISGTMAVVQERFHIAFEVGPKFTMTYEPGGGRPGVNFEVNKRSGEATAARCTVIGIRYHDSRNTEACMWYFNQYGNKARCSLNGKFDDDFNTIRLEASLHG